ncbi:MAG: NAD(P)-dependent oxidoreductase [Chthoniobacterales bacterium]|jgi:dTDP-4-dehydrorhamnose reductase
MKILLFGAGGLLGRHLAEHLPQQGHDVRSLTHAEGDITDLHRLDELFEESWDAVVNAAAVCDFAACENDPEGTARVNRDAPLDLARRCNISGSLFVQFSSDYVFDGRVDRLYDEGCLPAPLSVYGHQKAALEEQIPDICPLNLVLRLSWMYGLGGRTFMSLLPDLLLSRDTLSVAAGKKGCCLYASDAAVWIERLIAGGFTGLFNLVNEGETSWEEFAAACIEMMGNAGLDPRCGHLDKVPYGQLGAHWSKRPQFSCLDTTKISRALPPGPRAWPEGLTDFLNEWKSVAVRRAV